jgi:TonB-dependent receptor
MMILGTARTAQNNSLGLRWRTTALSLRATLAAGASLLTVGLGLSANAQTAPSGGAIEEIVITGQKALSPAPEQVKKSSLATVDSVGALQIQQLSDTTVADALSRLPGVSVYRGFLTNKSWYVDVRGFDGTYNSIDLDGGMFFDSTRNNRAVYLDTIPANAINELEVYKTVTPDMDANAIGGHISVKTLRAFDLDGASITKANISLDSYTQNGPTKGYMPGYTGDAVIKRTFGPDHNFGFVGSVSIHDDHLQESENNVTAYTVQNGVSVPSSLIQHGAYDQHDSGYSFLGKFEARSADRFYGFAEASYFTNEMVIDAYRANLALTPSKITSTSDGAGQFTGGTAEAFSYRDDLTRKVFSFTTGGEYRVTSNSKLSATASVESSTHLELIHSGSNFNDAGVAGSYSIDAANPNLALTPNAGLANPANWIVTPSSASVITHLPQEDHVYNLRIDYDFNNFPTSRGFGFAAGANVRRLTRNFDQSSDNYTLPTGTVFNLGQVLRTSPTTSLNAVAPIYINYDAYWSYIAQHGTDAFANALSSSYDLTEDVYAGYAAVYYTLDRLRLLAGVRYEATRVDDSTAQILNSVMTPFSYVHQYASLLPNVQGSYDVTNHLRLKAAYTETLARPNFSNFAPGQTVNNFTNQNTVTISGANPDLVARISNNYDLGLESYYDGGYFALGLFHKDISHEVYTLSTVTANPAGGVTTLSLPENAGTSSVTGVEASGEWRDFGRWVRPLDGFGIRANITYAVGRLHVLSTTGVERTIDGLNQLPNYEANLILYYDHGPYSGSMNFAARGQAFNSTVGATSAGDFYINPNQSLNARAAYRVSRNIQLFVEGRNLTNTNYEEVTGANKNLVTTSIRDGQTVLVGAQLTF